MRLVAGGLAAVLCAACLGTTPRGQTLAADVDRREGSAEFVDGTVVATNAFAVELYRSVASSPGNVAYGANALFTSLAMARLGATGTSREQFDTVLHAGETPNLDEGLNALATRLTSRTGSRRSDRRVGRIELERAVGLWTQRGTHVQADLLDALAADHGTGVHTTDFRADAEGARRAVNNWASDETDAMISELVPRGGATVHTLLLAASGESLRAAWAVPFDPGRTTSGPFRRDGDGTVDARMMEVTSDRLRHAQGDGWTAVELPYVGDELAFDAILPDGPLAALEARLTPDLLADIGRRLEGAERQPLQLRVPQFAFTTTANLQDPLRRMGLTAPQSREAEFAGVSTDEVLSLSGVPHQTVFGIDEEGTNAPEDTATAAADPPSLAGAVRVDIDRPFTFVVRDRGTGAVLVIGRVTNPG